MPATDNYTEQTLINSDPIFTSAIRVQAGCRLNIGVLVCGNSLDFESTPAGANSLASMSLVLQRKLPGDTQDSATASWDTEGVGNLGWRDVESWSILQADGYDASFELITDKPEPETCMYRIGARDGMYSGGVGSLYVRLGTS